MIRINRDSAGQIATIEIIGDTVIRYDRRSGALYVAAESTTGETLSGVYNEFGLSASLGSAPQHMDMEAELDDEPDNVLQLVSREEQG
tara:strand:+ start:796 stop:1059 length:264 start_codon:yes stop_codon:yes gene_type:complete